MMAIKRGGKKLKETFLIRRLKNYLLALPIFILWVLVKIGDGVLWLLSKSFILLKKIFFLAKKTFIQIAKNLGSISLPKVPQFKLPRLKPVIKFRLLPPRRGRPPKPKIRVLFPLPWSFKIRYFALGFSLAFFFLFLPTLFYSWVRELPSPYTLKNRDIPQTTKIYDRNSRLLYQIYTEQNRTLIPLEEIPDHLIKATIAIEDKDFYKHQGFDLRAIARAVRENLIHHKLQGGSTLTQQLVKSALLTPEPTFSRKAKEIFLAFWAERIYSKDQILEMYFNQVSYGGTAWGVEAASETYFGKRVSELNLAESALLAGLPAAPTTYSPFGAHPELSKIRQIEVLRRMVEEKYLNQEETQNAQNQKLEFAPQRTDIWAPHFVMYIKELLVKKYGERLVEQGGLKVTTSLDLDLQEMAQQIVKEEIEKLNPLRVSNGAALITHPQTGEILAMVGSVDYFNTQKEGNVNVALSPRQPGSAIKVVTYATALQKGFTAATILDDSPVTYQVPGAPPYSPVNYDGRFHGKIPLRFALGNSYNVPAVRVLSQIGVKNMVEQGRKMGITTWEDDSRFGLSLTLGGGEITLLDMARVYGVLTNQGTRVDLNPILEVKDYKGEILEKNSLGQREPVIPEGIAFILSHILADNQARTAAFGPQSLLVIPGHTVSVKTGTTNDKRDNWTIGFTPSFLAAVWVGNNDNSPMDPTLTSGVTGAAPIWNKIMGSLLKDKPNELLNIPEDIAEVKVCPLWGKDKEYFLKGTEPKGVSCPQISPTPTGATFSQ